MGKCRTCHPNSSYNGSHCECNHGYFGDQDNCEKCHDTCGSCSGVEAHECLSCIDTSYNLENGFCTKGLCNPGFYFH